MSAHLMLVICLVGGWNWQQALGQKVQINTSVCNDLPSVPELGRGPCHSAFATLQKNNQSTFLKLLPSHLQHNKDSSIRKRKLDIVMLDQQHQPICIFKGASTPTFRNEMSEVLTSAIANALKLSVVRVHSRGTLLPVQPENAEEQLIAKVARTGPLLLDGTKSLLVPGVSMDFVHDAYAYSTSEKLKQSLKKRFKADSELRKNFTHSYGSIRLLDALISNFDRTSKNCKVNQHGIWLAVDNDGGFRKASVYEALIFKKTFECLASFLPKGKSKSVQCAALRHAQNIVHCAPASFTLDVQQFLEADPLIQHFQLKSYPGKNESDCLSTFPALRGVLSYVGNLASGSHAHNSLILHAQEFCTINLPAILTAYLAARMQEAASAFNRVFQHLSC